MTAARRPDWALLGVLLVAAGVLLQWAGRGTTFFYDDWPYVFDRQDWTLDAFLEPHNEHLQAVSVLVYKVLFETVGLHHYGAYRAVLVLLVLTTGGLFFAYARPRVGRWPALALTACLVVMAPSWYNLVYAFQVNFVAAMAAGLGALLALGRGTRRGDAAAAALLCVSLASSSIGLPFLVGALVEVLLRGDRLRRAWVPAVPAVLYGAWRLAFPGESTIRLSNLDAVPRYVADGYDDSVAAIVGLPLDYGVVVAFALLVLVGRTVLDPARVTPRLVALIVMPLSLWALTALGRADQGVEADANRYLFASGLLVGLLAVEAARWYPLRRRAAIAVGVLIGFGALNNAAGVNGGGDILRAWSGTGKDGATALDLARGRVADYGEPDPTQSFLLPGRYFAAVDRYDSSPGFTLGELLRAPEERRAGTDAALLRVLRVASGPVAARARTASAPPRVEATEGGTVLPRERGCVRFVPGASGARLEVGLPAAGAFVRAEDANVELRLRRFAAGWPNDAFATVTAGSAAGVIVPRDRATQPWHAELRGDAPFSVCAYP